MHRKNKVKIYTDLLKRIDEKNYTKHIGIKYSEDINLEKINEIDLEISQFKISVDQLDDFIRETDINTLFATEKSIEMDKKLLIKLKTVLSKIVIENNARRIIYDDHISKNKIRKNYLLFAESQYENKRAFVMKI